MDRRGFLKSILAAGVAPAFVGSSILMPVRKIWTPTAPIEVLDELFFQFALNAKLYEASPLMMEFAERMK